jgi:hypothetical protein
MTFPLYIINEWVSEWKNSAEKSHTCVGMANEKREYTLLMKFHLIHVQTREREERESFRIARIPLLLLFIDSTRSYHPLRTLHALEGTSFSRSLL